MNVKIFSWIFDSKFNNFIVFLSLGLNFIFSFVNYIINEDAKIKRVKEYNDMLCKLSEAQLDDANFILDNNLDMINALQKEDYGSIKKELDSQLKYVSNIINEISFRKNLIQKVEKKGNRFLSIAEVEEICKNNAEYLKKKKK